MERSEPPCNIREYLPGTYDTSKSLVLLNYYAYARFSKDLMNAIRTCYAAASNRWVNFIVVGNEEEMESREAFNYFVDFLNGKHLCGCYDVNSCKLLVSCGGARTFMINNIGPIGCIPHKSINCSRICNETLNEAMKAYNVKLVDILKKFILEKF
ncbi:hypothetical protein RHMOL_Rhmol07G0317600 [Rhododendron molle]|uniref:Uncharacterized protein n=1 Tax=Rhododendron molle TaxID=49168 RepID=A0ACC0N801_RHOML|nr:hypothetical protein RHMOL_Rhmol07G0317600 [Rhododendron molle]